MSNSTQRVLQSTLAAIILPLALASCGEAEKPETSRAAQQDTIASFWPAEPEFKTMQLAPTTQFKVVKQLEFECVAKCFPRYFEAGSPGSSKPINGNKRGMVKQRLADLVSAAMTTHSLPAAEVGVKFHYGLSVTGQPTSAVYQFEVAVEVVKLEARGNTDMYYDVVHLDGALHPLDGNGAFKTPVTESSWDSNEGQEYFNHVVIRRNGDSSGWDKVVNGSDHDSHLLKWSDVYALFTNNNNNAYVNIQSIAGPAIRTDDLEDDWHHSLALVTSATLNGDADIDKDEYGGVPFKKKALDLGSPCPPSCVLAKFYRYGVAPAAKCGC